MASLDYSSQLDNLRKAQRNAAVADLQNTRNQALSNLTAEQQQNAANFATQRNTANAQNRLSARNFQEYLASTGRANSGLAAQASLQHGNNLNTAMNSIYGAENAANADILRRRTDAQNAYNSGLAAANANIEANYIQALLDEKARAFDRAMQEKQYQESVRQFNENLKLQKAQLNNRFNGGSGGGSRSYYKSGKNGKTSNEPVFTDTQRAYTPIVATRGGIGLTAADLQELNKGSSKTTNKNTKTTNSKTTNSKTKTNKELLTNKNTGLKVNITKKKK